MHEHLLLLSRYHIWAYETLYTSLVPLDDEQYFSPCGLFFGSIHGTLNHLLVAERIWCGRITGEPYAVAGLDVEIEPARGALEHAIYEQGAYWAAWIAQEEDEDSLRRTLTYTNLAGTRFDNALVHVLLHVFNHGTHHRGQISAALTALGLPAPVLDLIQFLRGLGQPLPPV